MGPIAFIVHGGAGTLRPELETATNAGMQRALEIGWSILAQGGRALEACEEAIVALEDDPVFNAGVGAHLNRDGVAQLDAILMDGASLASGAVGAVERIRNPIRLARLILEDGEHSLLVADGAERFAQNSGITFCDPRDLITADEQGRWESRSREDTLQGTVGAVALDLTGGIAAGTSTGGTFFKQRGRLGDSPLVGCGCYADNAIAGVSCTGHGESIMKVVMAKAAIDSVAAGQDAQTAADTAIKLLLGKTTGSGGLIIVDRNGRLGASFSTAFMAWAGRTSADH